MDRYKLEYERKKKGITVKDFCIAIGIRSESTYYKKCNGKSEFTLSEIKAIVRVLELDSPMEIFFADKVS